MKCTCKRCVATETAEPGALGPDSGFCMCKKHLARVVTAVVSKSNADSLNSWSTLLCAKRVRKGGEEKEDATVRPR